MSLVLAVVVIESRSINKRRCVEKSECSGKKRTKQVSEVNGWKTKQMRETRSESKSLREAVSTSEIGQDLVDAERVCVFAVKGERV